MNLSKYSLPLASLAAVSLLVFAGCSKHQAPPETKSKPPEPPQPTPPGQVVFNSFDSRNHADKSTAWAVMNVGPDGYRGQAEWFTVATGGTFSGVDLALTGKGSVNVTIAEDQSGLPGKTLESFAHLPGSRGNRVGHLILVSETQPVLKAGTKYWLCAEPADDHTDCSWRYNSLNLAHGFAYERSPGSWSFAPGGPRDGAFRIYVQP